MLKGALQEVANGPGGPTGGHNAQILLMVLSSGAIKNIVYIVVHTCVVDISIDHVLTGVSIVLVPFKVTSRLQK